MHLTLGLVSISNRLQSPFSTPAPCVQAIAAHPALATAPPPPEKLSPEEFPEDIENEANSYYQKIYESEQMTIQQVKL